MKNKPFKTKKKNYTIINFVSQAQYERLISQNKIDENVFYFIDNSIEDIKPVVDNDYFNKPTKNVLGVPVK